MSTLKDEGVSHSAVEGVGLHVETGCLTLTINEYINSPITNTPPDVFKAGYSIEDVGEALLLYDQLWTEVKGG